MIFLRKLGFVGHGPFSALLMAVGGGGAGGSPNVGVTNPPSSGGNGGGGEVIFGAMPCSTGDARTVTVGLGGVGLQAGGTAGGFSGISGSNGIFARGGYPGNNYPASTGGASGNGYAGAPSFWGGGAGGPAGVNPGPGVVTQFTGVAAEYGAGGYKAPTNMPGMGGLYGAWETAFGRYGSPGNNGVVMIRYLGPPRATGGVISTIFDDLGASTLHRFDSTGLFTVL